MGCATVLIVIARDTAVLASAGFLFAQPSFETLRSNNIAQSLNRMEIMFAIVLIVLFLQNRVSVLHLRNGYGSTAAS